MAENLNAIYGDSTDLKGFLEQLFNQNWDAKKEQRKAARAHPKATVVPGSTLSGVNASMRFMLYGNAIRDAHKAHEQHCRSELRNQLISNSLSAIGLPANGDPKRKLERIAPEFWITAEPDYENNSASDATKSYEHIRIVTDRYERVMNATQHIAEAIRHEAKLHKTNTGTSWWQIPRKDRISNCRAFIKNTYGINTLKTRGYSEKNFDKQFTIIRSESTD
jgi:hypothetical protein